MTILDIKNIYKSFGDNHIHKNLSLSLNRGETVALLGGSGTGKSVLLRSIIGLEFIDSGEIYFKDQDISKLSEDELITYRLKISYAFQSGALFDSISVFENIAYPLYEHTKLNQLEIAHKVSEMLKLIGLEGKEDLMPSDLSGGMQKRVGMARAIILSPDIILYDEPTAGLDPANTLNILELMKKLKTQGLTSLFVTHDIPAALSLCDRILVLKDGKIYFDGSTKDFKDSDDSFLVKFKLNTF